MFPHCFSLSRASKEAPGEHAVGRVLYKPRQRDSPELENRIFDDLTI